MNQTADAQKAKYRAMNAQWLHVLIRPRFITVAVWALLASIFLFDILTPPENISVSLAYAIPIFVSQFELKPRPLLYAAVATMLSLLGSFIQPTNELSTSMVTANRLIAVGVQWLSALLVRLQWRRNVDVQDKAEFQRRFVDILSHEVGTALTAIVGHAYRLTKLADQLTPGDTRERADKIRKATERIEAIIDRIQFASSLGDGTIPVGQHPIDLQEMIQQLIDQLKEERGSGSIHLNVSPEPHAIRGDEMLLRAVFENIFANSIKYSPQDAPVLVSVAKQGSMSRVMIVDRGSGIPKHELPKVREPYYRGETAKGTSGIGLGLYFAERIVKAHKGRLSIQSEVGKGTKVVIDLPKEGLA